MSKRRISKKALCDCGRTKFHTSPCCRACHINRCEATAFTPTADEITRACAALQATWSEADFKRHWRHAHELDEGIDRSPFYEFPQIAPVRRCC